MSTSRNAEVLKTKTLFDERGVTDSAAKANCRRLCFSQPVRGSSKNEKQPAIETNWKGCPRIVPIIWGAREYYTSCRSSCNFYMCIERERVDCCMMYVKLFMFTDDINLEYTWIRNNTERQSLERVCWAQNISPFAIMIRPKLLGTGKTKYATFID